MRNETASMEELKKDIENSEIFRMNREEDPEAYRKLAFTLVEKLYKYACAVNRSRYEDMGLEVVETAQSCVKSYRPDAGPFLNYFMRSLKRRTVKETAVRRETERRGGILFPETAQRQLFQLEAMARTMGRDMEDRAVLAAASASLEVSEERLRELLELNRRSAVISGERREDGNPGPLESVPDSMALEEMVIGQQDGDELLKRMDESFQRCREGQQRVLSMLLTARIAASAPELIPRCRNAAFFDGVLYEECLRRGNVPTAKEIAGELGRKEESVSRTLSRFLKSLRAD